MTEIERDDRFGTGVHGLAVALAQMDAEQVCVGQMHGDQADAGQQEGEGEAHAVGVVHCTQPEGKDQGAKSVACGRWHDVDASSTDALRQGLTGYASQQPGFEGAT
ncbi:hypothetical protein [Algiphilus sp.]|uniref:hypothetical protein n=1 Tax=Algiphilus sp. TaxID=1872431 RepID=UPI003BAA1C66